MNHLFAGFGAVMDAALWNLLHDGRIVSAEAVGTGDLRLLVHIACLCKLLPTVGKELIVELRGCERFEYRPFEGMPVTNPGKVAAIGLEMLRAGIDDTTMVIECADGSYGGQLCVRYAAAEVLTLEGSLVSQKDLDSAAAEYWETWSHSNAR